MDLQKDWWMHVDSYKELVSAFRKINNPVEKAMAFDYYANRMDEEGHNIFLGLLSSSFYSTTEVARNFYFADVVDSWQNKDSVKAVLDYIRPAIKLPKYKDRRVFDDKYFKTLEYFAQENNENFIKLLDALPPNIIFKNYFTGENQNEQLKQQIYSYNPDTVLAGAVGYYEWRIEEDLFFRKECRIQKKFPDWELLDEMVKSSNLTILKNFLELNLITKESIEARYSKDVIEQNEVLTHFVAPDAWKYFDSPMFVYEMIPEDQKWEALVYLIEHKPDVVKYFKNNVSDYHPVQIAIHFEKEDLSVYSETVQNFLKDVIKRRQLNNARARELGRSKKPQLTQEQKMWYADGELRQFFSLINGRKINSIDEYVKIANEFINSGLTTEAFCLKYKIQSIKEFRTFLNRLASYDESFKEALATKNNIKRQQFVDSTKGFIEGVITDSIDVTKEMGRLNPKSQSFADLYSFIDSVYENPKIKKAFTFKIVTHYFKRLNECGDGIDEESVSKRLTNGEVLFIMGATNLTKMKTDHTFDVPRAFVEMIKPERKELDPVFHKLVYGFEPKKISNKLKIYENRFQPNVALGMKIGSVNGAEIEVTREVLGQAEAFRQKYSLFPSDRTMTSIIRGIASGDIKIAGEEVKTNAELMDEARKKARECETIEEYFEILGGV